MIASGTLIGTGFVLTNRHVVEDHDNVLVRLPDGEITRAHPIPHDVPIDLVLLRLGSRRDDGAERRRLAAYGAAACG